MREKEKQKKEKSKGGEEKEKKTKGEKVYKEKEGKVAKSDEQNNNGSLQDTSAEKDGISYAEALIDDILSKGIFSTRRKSAEGIKRIDSGSKEKIDSSVKTPFSYLLKEISKYPLLKPEEEKRLAMRFIKYKDREAAKKLALANMRFVIKIALDYKNWGVPIEDLVSEGVIGLLFAIRKFNPNKGVKFISYASYWIKAFIHNYILSNFSVVKLGTTQDERRIFANIFKIRDETREEDIQMQAERLGVDEEKIKFMDARVRSRDISLDSPQDDEGSLKLADILKADETYDPLFRVEVENAREFIYKRLNDAFLNLTSQERQVIQQRYLIPKPKTLKELSDELKISKERIRQIEKRAFQKLRSALAQYAKNFRIDTLKDKVRRKRRSKEEMELMRMIEQATKKKKKRGRRSSSKVEPETTSFFDLKNL
jgi:alternative sigma factor RpoH